MNGVVPSKLHNKLLSRFRLSGFAGGSLVERMRSTTFALLGLTAAVGLTLVAIFAQPGGPLLSPAPLPSGPPTSVAAAEAVEATHASKLLGGPGSASGGPAQGVLREAAENAADGGRSARSGGTGAVGSPQPVSSPPTSGEGVDGNGGNGSDETPTPAASPPPAAAQAPNPVPVASPSAPEKTEPVQPSSPGRSTAGSDHGKAGANHGKARGHEKPSHVEKTKSSGHGPGSSSGDASHEPDPPVASAPAPKPPASTPPVAESPPSNPGDDKGNGKGHAYGHDR